MWTSVNENDRKNEDIVFSLSDTKKMQWKRECEKTREISSSRRALRRGGNGGKKRNSKSKI